MHRLLNRLIVYRKMKEDPILSALSDIFHRFETKQSDTETLLSDIYTQVNRLLDVATQYGFDDNLWQNYLAWCLASTENPFSLLCERTDVRHGSVNQLVCHDLAIIKALFDFNFSQLEQAAGVSCFSLLTNYQAIPKNRKIYNWQVSEKIRQLSRDINQTQTEQDLFAVVTSFYRQHGVGMLGLNHAFRISGSGEQIKLHPITNVISVTLDDLIGYESQKKALTANTEAFLHGQKANNLLLYGDSGTGKSTCIKAILNQYAEQGLRIIEIYKHQFQDLSRVIEQVKNRQYRFIIYMDDLSFEEFETDFKHLKAVIEGGIELTPDNVLIYATSNRRHLIRETWSDRSDAGNQNDLHHSDTAEEKISLVNRFGITIYFPRPTTQEYLAIVQGIVQKHPEIPLSEQALIEQAKQWGQWHGSISGRRAQQFVNDLLGRFGHSQEDEQS